MMTVLDAYRSLPALELIELSEAEDKGSAVIKIVKMVEEKLERPVTMGELSELTEEVTNPTVKKK